MTDPIICHFLVGLPQSGKTTFAKKLREKIKGAVIISTDTEEFFFINKPVWRQSIPSDEIKQKAIDEIVEAIASNKPVIYDATNVRRDWRMGMLMNIEEKLKEIDVPKVYWVAWHLQTPVDVCKEWNQKRDHQVPDDVIEEYADYLIKEEPSKNEAFFEIYSVTSVLKPYTITTNIKKDIKHFNINNFEINNLIKRIKSTENRISKYVLHKYSSQFDFDRLMYLISLIINYPGIGRLSKISPCTIKEILGKNTILNSDIDEISAVISKIRGEIYANKQLIQNDLKWLKLNLIEIDLDKLGVPLLDVAQNHLSSYFVGKNHSYSDLSAFSRLIKVLRYIVHGDSIPISSESIRKAENLRHRQFLSDEESQKNRLKRSIRNRTSKLIKALVLEMMDSGILEQTDNPDSSKLTTTVEGKYVDNVIRYYGQINDIDFPCMKEYKIKPDVTMKEGYYFGTGLFSNSELNNIYELLQSQSEKQYLSNELDNLVYQRFRQRLENSKILKKKHLYPVKAIGSKSIVDFDEDKVNKTIFVDLERAIRNSELIEIEIPRQPWELQASGISKIYPLQIIFHGQAWYLGYEILESIDKDKNGLFTFERIDRLKLIKTLEARNVNLQLKAFNKLNLLYQASAGIYLGNSVEDQKKYLNPKTRKLVEETFEIYATESSFKFLGETARRFPRKQMEMTLPSWLKETQYDDRIYKKQKMNRPYPHQNLIKITLPKWSVDDIYLIKWLVPWGDKVRVVRPEKLIEKIKQRGNGIQQIYENINLVVCDWNNSILILENKAFDAYISLKLSEISQHESIANWDNIEHNLVEINLDETDREDSIKNSLKLINKIYQKYKSRKYIRVAIYSSEDKKTANIFASQIYQAVSQNKSFENLKVLLRSC